VANDVKVKVLNKIKAETSDESLKHQIDAKLKENQDNMQQGIMELEEQAVQESDALSKEVVNPTILDQSPTETESVPKQASYRSSPHFDLKHLYSKVMQDKIAAMALNN
jgi:hypothetical protein